MSKLDLGLKIVALRKTGYSYNKIVNELKCSKSIVCYHLGKGQKQKKQQRQIKSRKLNHPFISKLSNFKSRISSNFKDQDKKNKTLNQIIHSKYWSFIMNRKTKKYDKVDYTVQDVVSKVGDNPKCYITGESIDIYKPRTYHFDHIIPISRGGDNSLDNLGLCSKRANLSKSDSTLEEHIEYCKSVLLHQGYKIHRELPLGLEPR